jgi:hypothetical protein
MSGKKRTSTAKSATADIGRSAAERDALQSLDDVAVSHALHRGELDTIGLLADMLEGRESTPWHLKRVLARRGAPSDVAGTALKNIRIGARIAAHSQSGEFIGPLRPSDPQPVLKNAIADICAEFGITPAHAHKCFALFQKYRFHNERDEPMPIPERSRRRRTKRAT